MRIPFARAAVVLAVGWSCALAQSPAVTFTRGQATFTQEGHDATWLLWQGTLRSVSDPQPGSQANFLFTPDGKAGPEDGGSLLRLTVTKIGATYILSAVSIEGGPAGPELASYRDTKAKCKLAVTRFDEKGVAGSSACTGAFVGGAAITKLYFSSTP
ncbi:MAG: hypothetical protein HY049_10265 [Acidobacteria bacterium]|nr:hypothetical protein [Acidobacteriota bacterium]